MGRKPYSNRIIIDSLPELAIKDLSSSFKNYISELSKGSSTEMFIDGFFYKLMRCNNSITFTVDGIFEGQHLTSVIQADPCPYGSFRFYFICSSTGKRVTKLYKTDSGDYRSRFELNAVYRTQKEHKGQYYYLHHSSDLKRKAYTLQRKGFNRKADKFLLMAQYSEIIFFQHYKVQFEKWMRTTH